MAQFIPRPGTTTGPGTGPDDTVATVDPTNPDAPPTAPTTITAPSGVDPLTAFNNILLKFPGNPQGAIDNFNQQFPGNSLQPSWYPGSQTIGLANGTYLVQPGSGGNVGTTWQTVQRGPEGVQGSPSTYGINGPYTNPAVPTGTPGTNPNQTNLTQSFSEQPFNAPTLSDLLSSPGFQAGADLLNQQQTRGAAANGSILSGGFWNQLAKAQSDYAQNAYGNLYNQYLNTYSTNMGTDTTARGVNSSEYQNAVSNALNQYNARYNAYQGNVNNQANLASLGLSATTASNPGSASSSS